MNTICSELQAIGVANMPAKFGTDRQSRFRVINVYLKFCDFWAFSGLGRFSVFVIHGDNGNPLSGGAVTAADNPTNVYADR
jgi:hypothetical protein